MAVTARQEGIVTCAGGTGLMVWLVVKTLWWRVYRVLTSCHVQLLQLWLVLISCCSHWINKGNMTQSNISVAVFALKCCWRDGTSFFSVILRCFFFFLHEVFLLSSCKGTFLRRESFSSFSSFSFHKWIQKFAVGNFLPGNVTAFEKLWE